MTYTSQMPKKIPNGLCERSEIHDGNMRIYDLLVTHQLITPMELRLLPRSFESPLRDHYRISLKLDGLLRVPCANASQFVVKQGHKAKLNVVDDTR
jgi:hypothetical protein